MWRFKITIFIFSILVLTVWLLNVYYSLSLIYLIFPGLFLLTVLIIASFAVNSKFYLKTICKIDNSKNEIAITFDDGPAKTITPEILEILKKYNVKAAFFCVGERIKGNQNLLLQTYQAGHLIGNHSYTHSLWFDFFSARKMAREFEETNDSIFQITGEKPVYFRPPYGVTNPAMHRAMKKFNFISVGWSLRSLDTVIKSKEKIYMRLMKKVKSGDIILFHDIVPASPQIIDRFISAIISKGFNIVRLDHLINQKSI